MITVQEAKRLLEEQVAKLQPQRLPLEDAVDCVLAADVFAPIDIPSFDQSSMDGFAVRLDENNSRGYFQLTGEIKAGDKDQVPLHEGEAVRIFTGAALPPGADAIVIQEKAVVKEQHLFAEEKIKPGAFIRRRGAQTKTGELAMKKGTPLTPAAIGFLASLGLGEVEVYRKPRVSIVVTGNEIIAPGKPLAFGQIYESNSFSLRAALQQLRVPVSHFAAARDEKAELKTKLRDAFAASDLLLVSGGISVGKYDLVKETLEEMGIEAIFYKIAQKPGKPLYAGKSGEKVVFALPGNPASVMVCFYEYVVPAIRKMMGYEQCEVVPGKMKTIKDITNSEDRDCFLRARREGAFVQLLDGQDSYMMRSFAEADAFVFISAGKTVAAGEEVEVHVIPNCIQPVSS